MLLSEVVETVQSVAGTRSRLAKVDALAALLKRVHEPEIPIAIGLLVATPRQGRIGTGWRGIAAVTADPAAAATLSLEDVDRALDTLASAAGAGSVAVRADALAELARRATAPEWDFLRRVILGELRAGALEGVLLDAIARASDRDAALVRRAAMLSGDLGETARIALTGSAEALAGVGLVVGRAVLPMLAATAGSATEAITTTGEASVEYKLDGARIQVHRRGDDVRIFTRTLADITHRVPDVAEIVRRMPVHDVILDGETLALDENDAPRPFQDTMARFGADHAGDVALRPWFFDILHVDGRDLIDEPLRVRREELGRVAAAYRVPGEVTNDPAVAERVAVEALAAGHEGVVVKATDSSYAAGRRGASWIKVKPVHTFDLVVLAAEWGYGRRTGLLSNLHLGARDETGEFGGGFVMVGKTFKGLTDALLAWQTERFPRIAVRETPGTVWVEPRVVVEIAIDGVQRSTRYPGGIALRFARVKRYRDDKRPDEADTIQTLRALLRAGSGDAAATGRSHPDSPA
ncbi:ATP-dependent DNA ligase [Microbacterium sp. SORGH_AS_0888]|uniref:ATP-dependent DNA ligase n=1 Tax=Microbacterium sp. SORGH_AS_0888 TaxID=3041791 RepID=UPI0027869242|nr:ATP-dependent DNA ligase [Microbacterium sp. SORGH_AS_0888]MDQ1128670.1 DNA ligase-1 [Microbacterium sp. SORGH_AS_0888]